MVTMSAIYLEGLSLIIPGKCQNCWECFTLKKSYAVVPCTIWTSVALTMTLCLLPISPTSLYLTSNLVPVLIPGPGDIQTCFTHWSISSQSLAKTNDWEYWSVMYIVKNGSHVVRSLGTCGSSSVVCTTVTHWVRSLTLLAPILPKPGNIMTNWPTESEKVRFAIPGGDLADLWGLGVAQWGLPS